MATPAAEPGPRLTAGAVHLWKAPLDVAPETLAWLSAPLCDAEIERAHGFAFPRDRLRWTAARGWLRRLLAGYLREDPAGLALRASPSGKPALHPPAEGLRFNLSHSAGLAVFALTRHREIGVDVEHVDDALGSDPVPRRFLSDAEQAALARLAPEARARAALVCWTAKEAYVKALGSGLGARLAEPERAAVRLEDGAARPPEVAQIDWTRHEFDVGPDYVATVVVEGRDARVPGRAELIPFATAPGAGRSMCRSRSQPLQGTVQSS